MHAAVMRACDPAPGTRVLWRLDRFDHFGHLYVVSPGAVAPDEIVRAATNGDSSAYESTAYDPFLDRLADGQQWRFRLTANPTRSVSSARAAGRTRGKVVPHLTASQQMDWFRQRARSIGVSITAEGVDTATVVARDRLTFAGSRHADGKVPQVILSMATCEGLLAVTDQAALRDALIKGLGRAKGYGCGLLTLAPP